MAYIIKNLGQRKRGDKLKVKFNKKKMRLILINDNYNHIELLPKYRWAHFIIPEDGIWLLKSKVKTEENDFYFDHYFEVKTFNV